MKRKLVIILIVLSIIAASLGLAWYFTVDIFGGKVIDKMVETVDDDVLEKADEIILKSRKSENGEEKEEDNKKETKSTPEKDTENKKTGVEGAVSGKNIEFSDKQAALNLAYSKFTQAEINEGLAKLSRGLTKEEYKYYVALAKSRFTKAEIEQIKAWYYKYR